MTPKQENGLILIIADLIDAISHLTISDRDTSKARLKIAADR